MSSKRMRLAELVALIERSSASAVQPPIIMPDPVDELDPKKMWAIRPSFPARASTEFELTHNRSVPLPYAINLVMCGETHACLYIAHGQRKVVYRVSDLPLVLKLTAAKNQ